MKKGKNAADARKQNMLKLTNILQSSLDNLGASQGVLITDNEQRLTYGAEPSKITHAVATSNDNDDEQQQEQDPRE